MMVFSLPSSFAFSASVMAAAMAWLVSGAGMMPFRPGEGDRGLVALELWDRDR